jgi:hypothetical protein
MNKKVPSFILLDKSVTLFFIKPFNRPCCHSADSSFSIYIPTKDRRFGKTKRAAFYPKV